MAEKGTFGMAMSTDDNKLTKRLQVTILPDASPKGQQFVPASFSVAVPESFAKYVEAMPIGGVTFKVYWDIPIFHPGGQNPLLPGDKFKVL